MTELLPISPLAEALPALQEEPTDPWAPAFVDAEPTGLDTAPMSEEVTERHTSNR